LPAKTLDASSAAKSGETFDQALIKALSHPTRGHVLAILNERVASPNELAKELGEGLSQVSYHVKVLKEYGCIELVKTEPRRGAVEHYYRATTRAYLPPEDWQKLPSSIRSSMSAKLAQSIFNEVAASLEAGTFDARDDRHVSWIPMKVDEDGWKDIVEIMLEAMERILAIRAASSDRLTKTGEAGIPVSVSMLGFQTPESKEMHTKPKGKL
jgi:DNA-binding transcriptional ArsR family regulator